MLRWRSGNPASFWWVPVSLLRIRRRSAPPRRPPFCSGSARWSMWDSRPAISGRCNSRASPSITPGSAAALTSSVSIPRCAWRCHARLPLRTRHSRRAPGGIVASRRACRWPVQLHRSLAIGRHRCQVSFGFFVGFDGVTSLAEETRDPLKNVPIILLATVTIYGLIVVGSCLLEAPLVREHARDLDQGMSPLAVLAHQGAWPILGTVGDACIMLASTAATIAFLNYGARVGDGGGGQAPAAMAGVDSSALQISASCRACAGMPGGLATVRRQCGAYTHRPWTLRSMCPT